MPARATLCGLGRPVPGRFVIALPHAIRSLSCVLHQPLRLDLRAGRSRGSRHWVWLSLGAETTARGRALAMVLRAARAGPSSRRRCWPNFPGFHLTVPNLSSTEISSYQGRGQAPREPQRAGVSSKGSGFLPLILHPVSTKMPSLVVACGVTQLTTPYNTHVHMCSVPLVTWAARVPGWLGPSSHSLLVVTQLMVGHDHLLQWGLLPPFQDALREVRG